MAASTLARVLRSATRMTRHVFDHEHAVVADLTQQSTGRFLVAVSSRCCGQQRAFGGNRAGDVRAGTGQSLHRFGLGAAGTGDDQQP